ncbi:MAG: methyltransferase domain-containing protein [bacterium]|nr:methyltransferase domain-containing protein [bacterium]
MPEQEFAYDITQYYSHPYSQTHPQNLYTIARLMGLNPKDFREARILELGCAAGGNIIPLAFNMPNAEIVGVDLSIKQVEEGRNEIQSLGLKNIRIEHKSITDIDESYGKFDYIICHGVYCWVPEEVQERILSVCQMNMAVEGVAYISYNTLPGWNMVKSVRDMMIYHVQNFDSPEEKAQQARSILEFMLKGLGEDKSPYAESLRNELEILSERSDSYLLHDHLEELNRPIYFHQFMEAADRHKLSYLADTHLANMYVHNLPAAVSQEFMKINDIVRTQQYMDFLRNQRFRCTLLCQKAAHDISLKRNINVNRIEDFYIAFNGTVNTNIDWETLMSIEKVTFESDYLTVTVTEPLSKIAMMVLTENKGKPLAYEDLCDMVMERTEETDREKVKFHLNEELNLMRLVLGGLINIYSEGARYLSSVPEKPMISRMARFQGEKRELVTNQRHENVSLNMAERIMIQYMDGSVTREKIIDHMCEHIKKGELSVVDDEGKEITGEEKIRAKVTSVCEESMQKFALHALFIDDKSLA